MLIREMDTAVSKRVFEAGAGSVVDYFDIAKGIVSTCLVGKRHIDQGAGDNQDFNLTPLMDVKTGEIYEVSSLNCITHYPYATLVLDGNLDIEE